MTTQVNFQILALEEAIEVLQDRISQLRGDLRGALKVYPVPRETPVGGKKRGRKPGTIMSAAARERIRAAQQKRWAAARAKQPHGEEEITAEEAPVQLPAELSVAVGQTREPQETLETPLKTPQVSRRGRPPGRGAKRGD